MRTCRTDRAGSTSGLSFEPVPGCQQPGSRMGHGWYCSMLVVHRFEPFPQQHCTSWTITMMRLTDEASERHSRLDVPASPLSQTRSPRFVSKPTKQLPAQSRFTLMPLPQENRLSRISSTPNGMHHDWNRSIVQH